MAKRAAVRSRTGPREAEPASPKRESNSRAKAGKLKSMRVSENFRTFVLDQLSGVPQLRAKSMFGGVGLYAHDVFFGIIAADVLYFKTDETTRLAYDAEGSKPFKPYDGRPMTMPYWSVPVGVLENAPALSEWARQSIRVAQQSLPAKKKRR